MLIVTKLQSGFNLCLFHFRCCVITDALYCIFLKNRFVSKLTMFESCLVCYTISQPVLFCNVFKPIECLELRISFVFSTYSIYDQ